jgi:DNA-binding transcriptional MerR regulator
MPGVNAVEIPNRSLFRQPEVCEIAQVQPYVLRSWEAEFPDLGVSRTVGGPRVYRRSDLERVLRLKQLLFVEGLTLAGARRKLQEEHPPVETDAPALDELLGSDARERILQVKQALREIAAMLSRGPGNGKSASRPQRAKPAKSLLDLAEAPARTRAPKHKAVKKVAKAGKPAKRHK